MVRLFAIVIVTTVSSCSAPPVRQMSPSFDQFQSAYRAAAAGEQPTLLDDFWDSARAAGIPLTRRGDTTAVFLFRGTADSVRLTGDMNCWDHPIPFQRIGSSDLFALPMKFPPDARLDYLLLVDDAAAAPDPANPRRSPSGFGPHSELAMPGFIRAPELDPDTEPPRGTLTTLSHRSEILGYGHLLRIYRPPSSPSQAGPYPVVYFQDGDDYVNFAHAARIFDSMINAGSIPPVIAVFVVPPVEPERNRRVEYALNERYVKFFTAELVPFIDAQFPTIAKPSARLVIGPSFGGLISLFIALRRPDLFSMAASQSGALSFRNDSLLTLFRSAERKQLSLSLDAGIYETSVGSLQGAERNFLLANRRCAEMLTTLGYTVEYREFPDGHSWGRWRNELPSILRHFLAWRH